MNKFTLAVAAALLAGPAFAGGHEATSDVADGAAPTAPPAGPQGGPPPYIRTQIGLANAGLLAPFYADLQYGFTLSRVGQSRARNNTINNGPPTLPRDGYENESFTIAVPWVFRKPISPTSGLTLKLAAVDSDEAENLISEDARFGFAAIGYETINGSGGMYAVELGYRSTTVERSSGTFSLERKNFDLKGSFAQPISHDWGLVGRAVYSPGDTEVDVTTPGGVITTELSEYYVYSQLDLIGNYTSEDFGFVPEGWKLHPQVGLTYMYSSFDEAVSSNGGVIDATSDNYGAITTLATLEKSPRPGTFSPVFAAGIEHVFLDDLSDFSDETTYGIVQAGVAYLNKRGSITYVGLHHREGFEGQRRATELTIAGNWQF